jgi:hypothetical protein
MQRYYCESFEENKNEREGAEHGLGTSAWKANFLRKLSADADFFFFQRVDKAGVD